MTHITPTPLISVIMPCLNGERHIQAAIYSVLAQTFYAMLQHLLAFIAAPR